MKKLLLAVAAATLLSGCATVTRGTNDVWVVETTPGGASVKTSNGFYCEATPCALKMPRKSEFTADISKAGYKPVQIRVTNKVSGGGGAGMAGNVILGGLIGVGVDATSGAMLDLVPNPARVTLEPVEPAAAAPPAAASAPPRPVS